MKTGQLLLQTNYPVSPNNYNTPAGTCACSPCSMAMKRERQMAKQLSKSESRRAEEVRRLGLLDTSPQERFDRITRLARARFGVPVAEINLLDEYRQFTKSPQPDGKAQNTPREDSFCDQTVQAPGILVVPDATKDDRFSGKATVTGDRHIRFYAGYALQSAGHQVGTLCIVDTVPRDFTADDYVMLERMGRWVEAELYKYATAAEGRRR